MSENDNASASDKILQVAEELFAEKGFTGTSMNAIAQKAGVNKALIYYYFKDKEDLIVSLFNKIMNETINYMLSSQPQTDSPTAKIGAEISFLAKRQKILAIMLMESLKAENKENFIFRIAETLYGSGHSNSGVPELPRHFVYEFFTGFIPLLSFIVFQDKWCEHYQCPPKQLMDDFLEAFRSSHLSHHHEPIHK